MELVRPAWEVRAAAPELPRGAAHVWRVSADAEGILEERWKRLLNPAELERLSRFHFPADARREAVGRGALRLLLGTYVGIAPERVEIESGPNGKPAVAARDGGERIEFNVTHSGSWVMLAFSRDSRVGIDVERWREMALEPIVGQFFVPDEMREWMLWPEAARREAFFSAWTLKEAYLKALGSGLAKSPLSFRVRIAPGTDPAVIWCADDPDAQERWNLARLGVAPGYSAALASERSVERLFGYTLEPPL